MIEVQDMAKRLREEKAIDEAALRIGALIDANTAAKQYTSYREMAKAALSTPQGLPGDDLEGLRDFIASARQFEIAPELREELLRRVSALRSIPVDCETAPPAPGAVGEGERERITKLILMDTLNAVESIFGVEGLAKVVAHATANQGSET